MKYVLLSLTALSLIACATTEEKAVDTGKSTLDDVMTRDTDGDGVPDIKDNCPGEAGTAAMQGCTVPQLVVLRGDRVEILEKVFFATDSDVIEERSYKVLDNVARVLKVHPEIAHLRIEGHTDNTGDHDYNVDLSKRRAASVVKYLSEHEIAADRMVSEGFGPDKPIADNESDEGRAKNRRVEFVIVKG